VTEIEKKSDTDDDAVKVVSFLATERDYFRRSALWEGFGVSRSAITPYGPTRLNGFVFRRANNGGPVKAGIGGRLSKEGIRKSWFHGLRSVSVSAGSSAPGRPRRP
jgi:hypothetical protein